MRKLFFILAISILATGCTDRNTPDDRLDNPETPEKNEGNEGGTGNENTALSSPKYIVEQTFQYTWVNDTTSYKNLLGTSQKYVYERETDVKYTKTYSWYDNDVLRYTISYKHEGLCQYGTYSYYNPDYYTYGADMIGQPVDTIIYYDEDRTLPKETRNGYRQIYTYDSKNRLLTQKQYDIQNTLQNEYIYTYVGKVRYGRGYAYSDGEVFSESRDTVEYINNSCQQAQKGSSWLFYHTENTNMDKFYLKYENEINDVGIIAAKQYTTVYYKDGSQSKGKNIYKYNWHDDLNLHYTMEIYGDNDVKYYIQEYYCRYVR